MNTLSLRVHLLVWANHAALNVGCCIRCLYHAALPPQVDHSPEAIVYLSASNPWRSFLEGLRD